MTENTDETSHVPMVIDTPDHDDSMADKPSVAERVEQARAKAVDIGTSARDLVERHPLAAMAGGIALGLVIGGLATSRRRKPVPANVASGLGSKATALAALAAELAVNYAGKAADAGREGVHKLEDIGSDAGGLISEQAGEARRKAGDIAEVAANLARDAAEAAIARASHIAARLKR